MTLLTALELASNYPDNILIGAQKQENGKFAGFCYLLRDGQIHRLMLTTDAVFDTEKAASDILHDTAVACRNKYGDDSIDIKNTINNHN